MAKVLDDQQMEVLANTVTQEATETPVAETEVSSEVAEFFNTTPTFSDFPGRAAPKIPAYPPRILTLASKQP